MVEFVKHLCKLKKELKFFMKWPFNKFIYVVWKKEEAEAWVIQIG